MSRAVAVAMVTHDSAADLPSGLAAIAALDPPPVELVLVDCASSDDSVAQAHVHAPRGIPVRIEPLTVNAGFTGGMNRALALSKAPFVLTLNADAAPAPDFLARLLDRFDGDAGARVAAVTGRLVRAGAEGAPRLDACGMRLTRSWRHLDRGSGEVDRGQFSGAARVFGATGAATLFRRAALEDVTIDGQAFDERFHSFREDAELAFRLRERDWEIVYEPAAVAVHRRRVLPERRSELPPAINYHSLKNRYLLRLDHQTFGNFVRTLPWTLPRDLGALAYALLFERTSLPAYAWLWRNRRELLARRRRVRARASAPSSAIDLWFRRQELPL